MPGIVVDSSFIIPVLVNEEHSAFAREAMFSFGDDDALIAPGLLGWEVASVLQKKIRQKRLSIEERSEILDRFANLAIAVRPTPDLDELAPLMDLCDGHGLTPYDAAYLLLALEGRAAVASLDVALIKAARAEGLIVHSPF